MGFSGHLVFARSERPLLEAPVFDGIDQELKDTADVSDSDIALVTGLGTDGQRWQAWLNEDSAAALLTEEAEDLSDGRPS